MKKYAHYGANKLCIINLLSIGNEMEVILKLFAPFILFIFNASFNLMVNTVVTIIEALVYM